VKSGKVRYVGLGNIPAWQAIDAHWRAVTGSGFRFVSCQGEYSLVSRGVEQELVPALQAMQANLLAHFPLAGGFLSGKYRRNEPPPATARLSYHEAHARKFVSDRNWEIVERLEFFCRQRGRTLLELAIGWLAGSPAVASIIAGASTPEQMEQNVRALDWRLTDGERLEIDRLSQ
jgi:aryl-alcohol dehydrogenase-like predicted oxidoreductase